MLSKTRRCAALASGIIMAACMTAGSALAQPMDNNRVPQLGDPHFLKMAMASDLAEIQEARMALRRSHNPAVDAFARRMIHDHSIAESQVKALAMSKGVRVPEAPMPMQREQAASLRGSGRAFAQQYARDQVQDHIQAVRMFEQEANSARDLQIRNLAAAQLPILREHLRLARRLERQVG